MVSAKFGSKSFEVSNKKIYTPNGISISEELDIEETAVSGKKPTVTVKGIKLQSMSFEVKLDARFVDVTTEITFWKNTLKSKKSQIFKLGNRSVGKFFLTKVEEKEIHINKSGVFTSALLSLSFTEDGKYVNDLNKPKTTPGGTVAQSIKVGSLVKPKSGARWYYTAEGAIKKTGKSAKAFQKTMIVSHIYKKNGVVVCCNTQTLGWLKVEDVTLISATSGSSDATKMLNKQVNATKYVSLK